MATCVVIGFRGPFMVMCRQGEQLGMRDIDPGPLRGARTVRAGLAVVVPLRELSELHSRLSGPGVISRSNYGWRWLP